MLSSPKYVNYGSLDMKLSPVPPASIHRLRNFVFKIVYNDEQYNLPNHYVDIYINDQFYTTTQEETIDLIPFQDIITAESPFIKVTVKTKRIVNGFNYYSDIETTLYTYAFFIGDDVYCAEEHLVRG